MPHPFARIRCGESQRMDGALSRSPSPATPAYAAALSLDASFYASSRPFRRLQSIEMSDTLYLSLWYPNLRLAALADKLTAVLGAFAAHGGEATVYAATVWPVDWSEAPVFQRVYGRGGAAQGGEAERR